MVPYSYDSQLLRTLLFGMVCREFGMGPVTTGVVAGTVAQLHQDRDLQFSIITYYTINYGMATSRLSII